MKKLSLILILLTVSNPSFSQETQDASEAKSPENIVSKGSIAGEVSNLDQFGFGPAFFVVKYDEEVLKDSKDVRLRGDGTINSSGSDFSTAFGVEAHYSFAFGYECSKGIQKSKEICNDSDDWESVSGHSLSPFIGLFDLDNGINGLAGGVVYGYWRDNKQLNNRTSLNVGIGYTVHKDRLVLANDIEEGEAPPTGLSTEDYTKRKDVEGTLIMISASVGF